MFFEKVCTMKKNRAFDHSKYALWINPNETKPYERNAKIHTDKQIQNICQSIRKFGWQQDTVITSDNVLVIGHGRRLAAIELGCEMPYHVIDKTADELTDEDIRELRIADNQTNAETGMNFATLEEELADIEFDGFDFDFDLFSIDDMYESAGYNERTDSREYFEKMLTFPLALKQQITNYMKKHYDEIVNRIIEESSND